MALTKFNNNAGGTKPGRPSAPQYRILYVEDEDQNWEIAEAGLRQHYVMQRASNAREAFDALKSNQFDLILMDIQLADSDLDGIEITRVLRKIAQKTPPAYTAGITTAAPIIFVTAYNARYSKEELKACGGDDLIPKPVDFTRLSLAISRCLSRAVLSRQ